MKFRLIFDAPVFNNDSQLGKLKRIIVNNGIANQITVDPGFLSYERVVPLSAFKSSSDNSLRLDITDDEWKAYPAYTMDQPIDNPNEEEPNLTVFGTTPTYNQWAPDTEHPLSGGRAAQRETVDQMSVVLSAKTVVVDETASDQTQKLHGVVIDTGRPQALLLDGEATVPFEAVTMLDEERIHIGGKHQQPILDADRGYEETTTAQDPAGEQRR